jgi:hypothetical protein
LLDGTAKLNPERLTRCLVIDPSAALVDPKPSSTMHAVSRIRLINVLHANLASIK